MEYAVFAAIIAITSAATAGATTVMAAKERNKNLRKQQKHNIKAFQAKERQEHQAAGPRAEKLNDDARKMEEILRVSAGETIGMGGTQAALTREVAFDATRAQSIDDQNMMNRIQLAQSGATARSIQIEGQTVNPFAAGISAALQGAQQGMQMASSIGGAFPGAFKPSAVSDLNEFGRVDR